MRRIAPMFLVLVLILSGCTKIVVPEPKPFPEVPTVEAIPFPAPHGVVSVNDTKPTWITNNIEVSWLDSVEEEIPEGIKIYIDYDSYSGLKDETIMASVNQAIQDKIENLKKYAKFENLPVTSGFYAAFPEGERDILSLNISTYATFNFANIMSVHFYVQVNFKPITGYTPRDIAIQDALNFDLTTGQQLTLSDLFVNDSDFEELLNGIILLKSQGMTDPTPPELEFMVDAYVYRGGFTGLRGDVKFSLGQTDLYIYLNEKYSEFSNDFSTVQITIPFSQLASILAIGQRCTQTDEWIYSDPIIGKTRNYLYVISHASKNWTVNDVQINSSFGFDEPLSEAYQAMALKALAKDRLAVEALAKGNVVQLDHRFSASVMGPYMNLISTTGISSDTWEMRGWSATIKPDGTPITMDDLFKDGFDYRSYIKGLIADQIRDNDYQNTYDLDQVYETLVSTLRLGSFGSSQYITMSNEYYFDATQDEGDFYISLDLEANKDILKIQHWIN